VDYGAQPTLVLFIALPSAATSVLITTGRKQRAHGMPEHTADVLVRLMISVLAAEV